MRADEDDNDNLNLNDNVNDNLNYDGGVEGGEAACEVVGLCGDCGVVWV